MDFASLSAKAGNVLDLFNQAKDALSALKSDYSGAKGALAATEVADLESKLEQIHAANLELSAELDDTMAKLQARG